MAGTRTDAEMALRPSDAALDGIRGAEALAAASPVPVRFWCNGLQRLSEVSASLTGKASVVQQEPRALQNEIEHWPDPVGHLPSRESVTKRHC